MTIVVFSGPSLRPEDRPADREILWLPPVAQGDVLAAVERGATVLGIVDGFFEAVPAVLHKEILYALGRGAVVFGAASMGALRAAELHPFGMIGIGRIFEMYRHLVIVDDDEVAVLHGPAEAGWPVVSEAMVNVRVTLEAAVEQGVVPADFAELACQVAKRIFYKDRGWDRVLAELAREGADPGDLRRLRDWLPGGRIDQKRRDAQELLRAVVAPGAAREGGRARNWVFEWTEIFDRVVQAPRSLTALADGAAAGEADLLDELRLDPELWRSVAERALLAALLEGYRPTARPPDQRARDAAERGFLARHGLLGGSARARWLTANAVREDALERLIRREARLAEAAGEIAARAPGALMDELRARGLYATLADRAARKRSALEEFGLQDAVPQSLAVVPAALRAWYFEQRLGRPQPDDLDAWIRQHGFADAEDFHRAILRERIYFGLGTRETSKPGREGEAATAARASGGPARSEAGDCDDRVRERET